MSFPYQTDLYVSISKNLDHDAEADNYIELNGIKSELVIVEAEV